MKSIGLGIVCLLCTLAWAEKLEEPQQEAQEIDDFEPLSIAAPFTYVEGTYALATFAKMNWFEAEAFCATQGYTLASISSDTRQNTIFNFIVNSGAQHLLTEPIWTSGTNLAVSNQWNWFSTGETMLYNNFIQLPSNTYSCVGLSAVTGLWTAENCNTQRYFVCQKRCAT